ncbi:MAG TPA: isoprenylcysteine carboxylmethyltransferase family protein [Burkholderiales bacterium]|nr:isoprenylcysteine carboxylmethyltransferase family protein [Burkholderiales bacterium]
MRFVPLLGVLLLIALAFFWRPWLQYQRHGTWGVILFRGGSWGQRLRDATLVVFTLLVLGQAVVAAARPELVADHILLQAAGIVPLFGGVALVVIAQLQMGVSWRIGIDEKAAPGLVTTGIFRFCRNPIYLAMIIVTAGYALLLPTLLSFVLLAGTIAGMSTQARTEEAYLLKTYGDSFRDYARRVGRFLPGIGKLH